MCCAFSSRETGSHFARKRFKSDALRIEAHVYYRAQHQEPGQEPEFALRGVDGRQGQLHDLAPSTEDGWRRAYKFRDKLMAEVVRLELDPMGDELKVIEAVYIP